MDKLWHVGGQQQVLVIARAIAIGGSDSARRAASALVSISTLRSRAESRLKRIALIVPNMQRAAVCRYMLLCTWVSMIEFAIPHLFTKPGRKTRTYIMAVGS